MKRAATSYRREKSPEEREMHAFLRGVAGRMGSALTTTFMGYREGTIKILEGVRDELTKKIEELREKRP